MTLSDLADTAAFRSVESDPKPVIAVYPDGMMEMVRMAKRRLRRAKTEPP